MKMIVNISGLKGTGKDVIARSIAEQLEEIYKERGEEGHPNTVMRTVRYSQWLKNLFMEFFQPVQRVDLDSQQIKSSPAKNYVPHVNDLVKKTYMFKDRLNPTVRELLIYLSDAVHDQFNPWFLTIGRITEAFAAPYARDCIVFLPDCRLIEEHTHITKWIKSIGGREYTVRLERPGIHLEPYSHRTEHEVYSIPYDVLYLNDKDKDSQEHKDEIRKIAESIMMVLEM